MRNETYRSSLDPALRLTAEFHLPAVPRPLCLFFHGWHMTAEESRKAGVIAPLLGDFFVVSVDMRGRGGSGGTPDASGFELIDGLDALEHARRMWPELVDDGAGPYAVGGSGGGGNVLALVGKAPDIFAAAVSWAGMSDYALWYRGDGRGIYRDEMEEWIGGSPDDNPEGYRSRGGLHVIENVLTPTLVIHGTKDEAVPVRHAEEYERRSRQLKKETIKVHYNDLGHACADWPIMLRHLHAHPRPPELPARGSLLVHGFLACRAFRMVLEEPSRMGRAEYHLDAQGRLAELHFRQPEGARPVESSTLFLADAAKRVEVHAGATPGSPVAPHAADAGRRFRLTCPPPWTLRVRW